jgi:hypothetical protein
MKANASVASSNIVIRILEIVKNAF